jgi:hypothetical protein
MIQGAPTYIVTDIEANGPHPGRHSMLSFASVALTLPFQIMDQFVCVLEPIPGRVADVGTLAWFQSQPIAWANATANPQPAAEIMRAWTQWLRTLPAPRIFVSHGLAFDGGWIDDYLTQYTSDRLIESPRAIDPLFQEGGICLRSLVAGALNLAPSQCIFENYSSDQLGGIAHNHTALDDATGYAHLLASVLGGTMRKTGT